MSATAGPDVRVHVVGTGLLGTSVALGLRATGVEVTLDDLDPATLAAAVARGAGRADPTGAGARVVIVAVPPAAVADVVIASLAAHPEATVTDVASIKARPLRRLREAGADLARVVGGHPLAGREVSGPAGARDDLVADRVWVLTPSPETEPARVAEVTALVERLGAVPVVLDPEAHDRAVALTSHTPQVLASLLASRLAEAEAGDVAISGQGLRDVTRVAASDPSLWTEILGANAGPVADVLDALADDLERVRASLRGIAAGSPTTEADTAVVSGLLRRGNEGRRRVPDKHGGRGGTEYVVVPVVVEDRAGQLGRLFAAAGEAGVSIEDVRIEHTLGRLQAVVELSVTRDAAPVLIEALTSGGWTLRG